MNNVKAIAGGGGHSLALKADGTVVAWGRNIEGQTDVPSALTGVIAVSAGGQHSLALKADGTVVAWGYRYYGVTNVPSGLSGVTAIAAGGMHSLALKADGTVKVWGSYPDSLHSNTNPPAGLSNVIAIAAGFYHSLALKSDGTVVAWGWNSNGQTNTPAGLSNVVAIAAGYDHSLALKSDGKVISWGLQNAVPEGLSNVVAIAAGNGLSLALKSDGTLAAWGSTSGVATNLPANIASVKTIACGSSHCLALVSEGPPEIVEEPTDAEVAYGSNIVLSAAAQGYEPLTYMWTRDGAPISDATRFSGKNTLSLSISNAQFNDTGIYRIVVSNAFGLVQSSGAILSVTSAPIILIPATNRTVVAGSDILLLVQATGTQPLFYQWLFEDSLIPGATKSYLQLNNIQANQSGTYSLMISNEYGITVTTVSVLVAESTPYILTQPTNRSGMIGGNATFSVIARGTLPMTYQWQRDGVDIPGATNSILVLDPLHLDQNGYYTVVVGNAVGTTVSAKAFLSVSQVAVWGNANLSGLTNFPAGLTNVVAISAGNSYLLALKTDGTVASWGGEVFGGLPIVVTNFIPTNVPSGLSNVMAISAGDTHCLALKSNGTVVAWGNNSYGQTNVPLGLSNVIAIAAGEAHSLALKNDGSIIGWGAAGDKFPLNGDLASRLTNAPPGLTNITAIAAGGSHNIALKSDGTFVYWGATTNLPISLTNAIAVAFKKGVETSGWSSPHVITKWDYYSVLRADGTVVPWSDNNQTNPPNAPLPIVPGLSNAVAISGSINLVSDGTIFITNITDRPPAFVSNVIAIAAGIAPATGASGTPPITYPVVRTSEFFAAVIGNGSPEFTLQPASQTASIGSQVQLHARAVGVQPLQYQWQLNGADIPGATNGTLTLTNVHGKDTGTYRAWAINALGQATSSSATLEIPFDSSLAYTLNTTNLTWLSIDTSWFGQNEETHDGDVAAQSGHITHNQQSILQTTVTGPGTLTFWWKVSSEQGYDLLSFNMDVLPSIRAISGETDWQQTTIPIPSGSHVVRWVYSKDSTVSAGRDAGWLDNVTFMLDPPVITEQPLGQTVWMGSNVSFQTHASWGGIANVQWLEAVSKFI